MSATVAIDCPTVAETPTDGAHFFGFHDISPWDPADATLAVLRVDPQLARLPAGELAEVCLWRPDTGALEPIGETAAWNFQMGARAQWLPDGRLVYNTLDGDRLAAEIVDPANGAHRTLPFAIGALSPDGRTALSAHYGRLARYWPAYGVAGTTAPAIDEPAPAEDGIWTVDLASGAVRLLVSIAAVAPLGAPPPAGASQFLTHPDYNPAGTRFVFLHRYFTADGALYSRLIAADADGGNLALLVEEKVSHFDWHDDDTVLVWARAGGGALAAARRRELLASPMVRPALRLARRLAPGVKQVIGRETYQLVPVADPASRRPVGAGVLDRDGHPMFGADRRWMLTDTYPDGTRRQTLILYEMATGRRIDIGHFHADPAVGDGDIKCDLHPR